MPHDLVRRRPEEHQIERVARACASRRFPIRAETPAYLAVMRDGLLRWMQAHEFARIEDACGRLSLANSPDPASFERGNYIRVLGSWKSTRDFRTGIQSG